jgi:hypothetical protein
MKSSRCVVSTSRSFSRSWLMTGFVARITRLVSLVEQELLTLPEHPSSPPVLVRFDSKASHEDLITTMHAIACLCTPNMSLQDMLSMLLPIRRVWGYQRGNQNPYIEEEQTTQWPREKVQKDKQRSTKHTHKSKDRVPRTLLKPGVNSGAQEG